MDMKIVFDHTIIKDDAKGIGTVNFGTVPEENADMLKNLESLRTDLTKIDQLTAAITDLEDAIRARNKPKAQSIIDGLKSFTSSFLANVIADLVKPFL